MMFWEEHMAAILKSANAKSSIPRFSNHCHILGLHQLQRVLNPDQFHHDHLNIE